MWGSPPSARRPPSASPGIVTVGPIDPPILRFAGDISPRGIFLLAVCGARRLADRAWMAGATHLIVDSPGFIGGSGGREFQVHLIDLLRPDWVVAIEAGGELDHIRPIIQKRREIELCVIPPSPHVRKRTPAQRRTVRERRFREYFAGAQETDPGYRRHRRAREGPRSPEALARPPDRVLRW
ncbi:MAG: Clp1/GlmU family protein [Methanomicrobiales archaeon]